MGGLCSKRSAVDKSPSDSILNADCLRDENHSSDESTVKVKSESVALPAEKNNEKWLPRPPLSFSDRLMNTFGQNPSGTVDLQAPQLSRIHSQKSRSTKSKSATSVKAGSTKVSEVSSILGRAGTVGLGKAVEVLDNFGSSVSSLNLSSSFVPGSTAKGGKISILAFEVANTVVKGANLLRSLSEENLKHLKEVVLPSESVQLLISKDMDELLRIAASDKREELKVFSGEVVRFGNRCKDPQWHNLDRYFEMNNSEQTIQSQLKQNMETVMQQLMSMAQFTAELYHELHSLDRLDQDYRRKLQEEEILTYAQRGDNLQILKQELKSQKKHVKNLKKKSLWSRMLEEVMEKLVDVVDFLNVEIHNAFGSADGDKPVRRPIVTNQRLGLAGLALHYANVIIQIDTLASRPNSVPSNMRDSLYQGLPPSMKDALRMKLHSSHVDEEATAAQMKNEMDKTLRWLVPIANNTSKSHHGFGWVGEWATAGAEQNRKPADLIRIETLYHADKIKIESYMLELIVWLHHLVGRSGVANGGLRSPIKSPIRSPTSKSSSSAAPECALGAPSALLSHEDQEMLRVVNFKKLIPGISKSQEFDTMRSKLDKKHERLSKSSSHSPTTAGRKEFYHPLRRPSLVPIIDFEIDKVKALDVIDRVDTQTHDLTRQSRRH